MGVIIAKVFDKRKEPVTPEFIVPTPVQIQILKETWEIPKQNLKDSGEIILFRYLDKYPKNQDAFDAFRNVPLLSLKGTPGFRTHAVRIMAVFQGAIDTFDTDDVVGNLHKNFEKMALSHGKMNIQRKSFLEMREAILEVLTEVCNLNEEQQAAWLLFFNCAINIIFGKFDEYYASIQPQHNNHHH